MRGRYPEEMVSVKRTTLAMLLLISVSATSMATERRPPAIDRTVVRWAMRDSGKDGMPRFITARELAFEARIEAMGEGRQTPQAFGDSHVRSAIQRHIAEQILAQLPVDPPPTPAEVGRYAEDARIAIEQQVGGRPKLNLAANAEGITAEELNAMLRRRARATYYLDKMVAPMLQPSESDLREAHQRGDTPFTSMAFEEAEGELRRWYASARLKAALDSFYRSVRTKVAVAIISWT